MSAAKTKARAARSPRASTPKGDRALEVLAEAIRSAGSSRALEVLAVHLAAGAALCAQIARIDADAERERALEAFGDALAAIGREHAALLWGELPVFSPCGERPAARKSGKGARHG